MAIGSILGSIAGGIASAGATQLAGNIFGGRSSTPSINRQVSQGSSGLSAPSINTPQINFDVRDFNIPRFGTQVAVVPTQQSGGGQQQPNAPVSQPQSEFQSQFMLNQMLTQLVESLRAQRGKGGAMNAVVSATQSMFPHLSGDELQRVAQIVHSAVQSGSMEGIQQTLRPVMPTLTQAIGSGSAGGSGGGQAQGGQVVAFQGNQVGVPKIDSPRLDLSGATSAFDKAIKQFQSGPARASSRFPGLTVDIDRNAGSVNVARTPQVQAMIDSLRSEADRTVSGLSGLLDDVNPGFGKLTDARVRAVESARQRGLGDLRDNIARRRISGSSFAQDQVLRGEREFADAEAQVRAQSFLEELEATRVLLDQRMNVRSQAIEMELSQTNFESQVGSELLSQTRQQMEDARKTLAELQLSKAQMLAQGALQQGEMDLMASIEQGRQAGASARLESELALRAALGEAELALRAQLGQLDAATATAIAQGREAGANQRTGAQIGLESARLGSELDAARGATFGRIFEPAISGISEGVGGAVSRLFSPSEERQALFV